MVSGLIFKRKDPQNKARGAGYYYYRGSLKQPNGRRVRTWSKYNEKLDAKNYRKQTNSKNIKSKEKNQAHKADYKSKGKKGKHKSHRISNKGPLGYF